MFGVLIAETSRYSNQRKGIKRSERRSVRAFTVGYVTVASRGSRVLNARGQWRATSNARLHPSLHNSRSLPAPFPSSFPLSRPCRYTVIFYVIPSCPAVGHSCAGARRESMRGLCAARNRRRYSRYVAREKRGAERNARVKKASENFPPSPSSSCPSPFFFLIDPRVPLLPFLSSPSLPLSRGDATSTPTFRTLFTSRTTNDPGRGSFLSSSSLSPAAARDASAPDRWPIFDQRNAHGMDGSRVVDTLFLILSFFVRASDRSREGLSRD